MVGGKENILIVLIQPCYFVRREALAQCFIGIDRSIGLDIHISTRVILSVPQGGFLCQPTAKGLSREFVNFIVTSDQILIIP
ncbi:hypothetical protein D3874_22075 [Oleomonas cavernae]|uniref:Uncharacterized protein n=1 Tax=Oleomonas cavernae TaxID=2320859 RepID=A0A418WH71_9PROT|nr:hypothetical protein D3874_22075 [Oleomonas cavernae]